MTAHQQNPDGSWTPAEPIPWQPGIDWEIYKPAADGLWRAVAYRGPTELARVQSRTKLGLHLRATWRTRGLR